MHDGIVKAMEVRLTQHGFSVLTLPSGRHAVSAPSDDSDDGFYLEGADRAKVVMDSHDQIFANCL